MAKKWISICLLFFIFSACNSKNNKEDSNVILFLLLHINQSANADNVEDYNRDVEIISDRIVPDTFNAIQYEIAPANEIQNYRIFLDTEIEKYPRGYWIKGKAEKVVLGKNLKLSGQSIAAVPDAYQKVLYLSINGTGASTQDYLIHVIHHELNHNVDFAHYGDMRKVLSDWNSLNTPGFQYGNGGAEAYANPGVPWMALTNPVPGFINLYSTLAQEEDRSELMAVLMGIENENTTLKNICAVDPIVANKVKKLISILNKFWPYRGNDTYWNRINSETTCD
ncbi:LIC13305 family lipoprotein [Leptospira noguchii]|uniref:Uncharacterized protein n=2 Tax=Leptospira noguchii TaxID=28182 RepID=A0A9Q8RRJ2_9LEPT|nr:hypothetical protein [Leptospira noguchii]EMO43304.1 putative lipoprotein [Leptospira noguchii serovar Autumnalis str. ZUN142]TQE78161.1 hypothetical protein FF021_07415 [Leptospira noguchii]UOG35367.1 hypothetical protein MAL02_06645 [Leptospira noguchii]UOG46284.1 hypothetical protein MAL01_06785 [Leptospira noguchii]UOG54411.1 hypothetical protein MAL09_07595 [Leptospira noguchii]